MYLLPTYQHCDTKGQFLVQADIIIQRYTNTFIHSVAHPVLPVKAIPARSGLLVTASPNVGPSEGTKFMMPSGMPASLRMLKTM